MQRVLVVDDAVFMRKTISGALLEAGFEVAGEARTGVEAVKKYRELNPDVVTMDITMPDMDGIEAVKKIKEYDPDCKIIIISAMGQDSMVKEALMAGAVNFLVKPLKMETIVDTMKRALG
ncbi:MAG: response regulator [Firmicutes bacterium]|nr:response regulator [Bacillota bacterium]